MRSFLIQINGGQLLKHLLPLSFFFSLSLLSRNSIYIAFSYFENCFLGEKRVSFIFLVFPLEVIYISRVMYRLVLFSWIVFESVLSLSDFSLVFKENLRRFSVTIFVSLTFLLVSGSNGDFLVRLFYLRIYLKFLILLTSPCLKPNAYSYLTLYLEVCLDSNSESKLPYLETDG